MRTFTRRDFLKGSGTLVLAAAASGLLCGAGEVTEDTTLGTVGGLRVQSIRARISNGFGSGTPYLLEIYLDLENTNDTTAYFYQENFMAATGGKRYDGDYFAGLNKWNGSKYIQDARLDPGEIQTLSYACRLDQTGRDAAFRDGAQFTLQYGQERQTYFWTAVTDKSAACTSCGPVQSTVFPAVGGVQLSSLWCCTSTLQNRSYFLDFYFTLQNLNDTAASLPLLGLAEDRDALDNFTFQMDGAHKRHYRLYTCGHNDWLYLTNTDYCESLQPQEARLVSNSISLTKEEYDSLYTQEHTVELTFTYGGESLTLRGDPRTGVFAAV